MLQLVFISAAYFASSARQPLLLHGAGGGGGFGAGGGFGPGGGVGFGGAGGGAFERGAGVRRWRVCGGSNCRFNE